MLNMVSQNNLWHDCNAFLDTKSSCYKHFQQTFPDQVQIFNQQYKVQAEHEGVSAGRELNLMARPRQEQSSSDTQQCCMRRQVNTSHLSLSLTDKSATLPLRKHTHTSYATKTLQPNRPAFGTAKGCSSVHVHLQPS